MEEKNKTITYQQKRKEFKFFRTALESRLETMPTLKDGIKNLINQRRPRTDNGELICAPCDMVSMVPKEEGYQCEICYGNEIGRHF